MTVNLIKSGLAALATLAPALACATQITISNADGNGEGFNDPTPVAAVGGNNATTLGAQRLAVFERAADVLESRLDTNIEIVVNAQFNNLPCSSQSAVLGSAGASNILRDFNGAPVASTWYPVALANDLANTDLNATFNDTFEISATFNSDIDNNDNCLAGNNWYYGFDDPNGPDNSLLSVVIHELLHGLGFTSAVNADGTLAGGYMDVFSRNLFDQTQNKGWDQMTAAERLSSSTNDGNLVWNGNQANSAANALPLSNGLNGGKIQMYAPSSYEEGSSVSHFSTAASPNELMEPSYTEFLTSPGLAAPLLADLGWTVITATELQLSYNNQPLSSGQTLAIPTTDTSFPLSGGKPPLSATLSVNGTSQDSLVELQTNSLTIKMPTSGAFAGRYELQVTDADNNSITLYLDRPLRLNTNVSALLDQAIGQQVWIEGAAPGTSITLTSDSPQITTTDGSGQATEQFVASNDGGNFNRAVANLTLATTNLPTQTTLTASATNLLQGNQTLDVLTGKTATITVTDTANQPVTGARIEADDQRLTDWGLASSATTGSNGQASLTLARQTTIVTVSASGYGSKNITLAKEQTNASVQLQEPALAFSLNGNINASGFSFDQAPTATLTFADGQSENLTTLVLTGSFATFRWEGDLNQQTPVRITVDHPQARSAISRDISALGNTTQTITVELSALENNGGTLDLGGSGGGGSPFSLLLLLGIIEFLRRKAFTV